MSSALFKILKHLDEAKIHYFIERHRPETIDITATVVGQRIEFSVFEDDHVEISRFLGSEDIEDIKSLDEVIENELRGGD